MHSSLRSLEPNSATLPVFSARSSMKAILENEVNEMSRKNLWQDKFQFTDQRKKSLGDQTVKSSQEVSVRKADFVISALEMKEARQIEESNEATFDIDPLNDY